MLKEFMCDLRFYDFRKKIKRYNVKGLINRNEAWQIFRLCIHSPLKGSFVEIGSFQGYSTAIIAYAATLQKRPKIFAIDPHLGYPGEDHKISDTYPIFLANLENLKIRNYVEVMKMTSAEAAKNWDRSISFLWIDGDHDYEAVKLDYTLWNPYLVKNGIIAFHDAGIKEGLPGPRKVVAEIELTKKFEPFQYMDSVAWTVKK